MYVATGLMHTYDKSGYLDWFTLEVLSSNYHVKYYFNYLVWQLQAHNGACMAPSMDNERIAYTWDLEVGGTKCRHIVKPWKTKDLARYLHTLHATNNSPARVCEDIKDPPKGWMWPLSWRLVKHDPYTKEQAPRSRHCN